ncbi:hypothetical protein GCM10022422_33870 [Flavobacterium ginsengisoli]|uniref:Fibronectin type-III domain-containing protein n=1 Tax=Flavobacterium ginsengisoli TaxID=871694 RepID=A0ABP7FRT4_9FLAO
MKNLFNNIYFFVLFLFFNAVGYAQLYPVQLTPVFNSPYSVKISDYATSMDTKMQLLINPTDISISQRRVRLKLYIQGNGLNIQTSDYAQEQRPIYINGGELQTLTNVDIASLFRLENLQGMTPAQYANPLPEGMYNFCFEMYDFVTNQKISQKSCANLYLILNDPPLLNTPQKNEQIASTEFPNILFTWTPRQINATNISYKFELKQLLDPTLDPQIGFQMSPTLYEETLYGTAVLYNLSMPILTPGLRYAWRVRAISTTGLSENSVFKNDGYSEIYSFKYTASCAAPTFLLSEAQSSKSVKITWEGIPEHTRYQVQYKKQDVRNAQWFSSNSLNRQSLITNLEPGVTYEFRVGSSCDPAEDGVQSFTYSNTSTFTTPTESNGVPAYNCGIVPQINIQNQKPLTNLIQSETFKAGDFPVTILELQGKNSPYSGRGYIIVPYLADTKIAVEFKDIVINTDYQLISGVVETSYNPDWKNVTDVEDFTGEGKGGQIEEKVPFVIKDIVINANGDIVVNGENGEQITIPGGKDTVITDSGVVDKDGKVIVPPKVYTVDSEGNGSNQGVAVAEGGKPLPENTDGVDKSGQATGFTAKGISIAFSGNGSKYAFDVMPDNASAALKKMYAKAGDNVLPYKAVLNGDSDTVIATVKLTDSNIKLDSIVFKTQNGAKIDFKRTDNVFVLTVKGNLSYAEEEILATVKQGKKWQVIGAFMLVHISSKDVNVALVPTYDNSENRLNEIVAKTQEIYSKIGVKINFKKEVVLNIDKVVSGSVIQTEKNTITSTYSAAQQNINALYKGDGNSYVLFITNKEASTGQKGYMRLNGQFGYVFKSADDKIAAHELGHGIFKLEHPFEQYKTVDSSTDFLMDYSSGTVLNHLDWKQINDPAFKLYAFQSQSSGELAGGFGISPDFKLVSTNTSSVVSDATIVDDPFVGGFVYKNELKVKEYYYWTGKKYQTKTGKDYPETVNTPSENSTIWLLANNNKNCKERKFVRTKYSEIKALIKAENKSALQSYIDQYINQNDTTKVVYSGFVGCSASNQEYQQLVDGRKDLTDVQKQKFKDVLAKLTAIPYDLLTGKCNDIDKQNCKCIDLQDQKNIITSDCLDKLIDAIQGATCTEKFIASFEERMDVTTYIGAVEISELLSNVDDCVIAKLSKKTRYKLYELMFHNSIVAHPYSTYGGGYIPTRINKGKDYLIIKLLNTASSEEQAWFVNTFLNSKDNANRTKLNFLIRENPDLVLTAEILKVLSGFVASNGSIVIDKPIVENKTFLDKQVSIPTNINPIMIYYENWFSGSNKFKVGNFDVTVDESELTLNGENKLNVKQKGDFLRNDIPVQIDDNYYVNPWDDVTLIMAKDMEETIGLQVGKTIKTKAIYALFLQEIGNRVVSGQNTQIATSAIAIVGAVFTYGASLELLIAGESIVSVAGLQALSSALVISASATNLELLSQTGNKTLSPQEKIALQKWNTFYNYLLLLDGGINIYSSIKNISSLNSVIKGEKMIVDAENASTNMGKVVPLFDNTGGYIKPTTTASGTAITAERGAMTIVRDVNNEGNVIHTAGATNYNKSFSYDGNAVFKLNSELYPEYSLLPKGKLIQFPKIDLATKLIPEVQIGSAAQLMPYNVSYYVGLNGAVEIIVAVNELTKDTPQVVYASPEAAKKLKEREENDCTVYTKFGVVNCMKFRSLLAETGKKDGVDKLYNNLLSSNVGVVLNKLIITADNKIFLDDILKTTSTLSTHISQYSNATITNWNTLYDNKKEFARKDWNTLIQLDKLNKQVTAEILKFSDASNTQSTLKEFTGDLERVSGFVEFLNNHIDYAKGFVGHKQSVVYTPEQYELLTPEKIEEVPLNSELHDIIVEWVKYSKEDAKRQNYFKLGKDFEKAVETALKYSDSAEFQDLLEYIPDLGERQILSQVQFCINEGTSCTSEGQYFIADFVFIKKVKNAFNEDEWDVVIADTKLSEGTSFTDNQKKAMGMNSYYLKSIKMPPTDIKGKNIEIQNGNKVFRNIVKNGFIKIYSNGQGVYKSSKISEK